MIRASINNLISVTINQNYPWKDTLLINYGIADFEQGNYEECKANIYIEKCKTIETHDCSDASNGLLVGANTLVDLKYGVRLERKGTYNITLKVTRECNEWLIMCIQLLLLELNCTLIHAAALEKNGEVLLLPALTNVGKTAIVMSMVNDNGWRLLGDDFVILSDNQILPFLKPFVIYPYHKALFPEVFNEYKGRIITNLKLFNFISKIIPITKSIIRLSPSLLAFTRKHNPHSLRISPKRIFNNNQLSCGGKITKIVWLEKIKKGLVSYDENSFTSLASKTVSASIMEIFVDRLPYVFALGSTGIFTYREIYIKMYHLIVSAYKNKSCFKLDIPTSVEIEEIGTIVLKYVANE